MNQHNEHKCERALMCALLQPFSRKRIHVFETLLLKDLVRCITNEYKIILIIVALLPSPTIRLAVIVSISLFQYCDKTQSVGCVRSVLYLLSNNAKARQRINHITNYLVPISDLSKWNISARQSQSYRRQFSRQRRYCWYVWQQQQQQHGRFCSRYCHCFYRSNNDGGSPIIDEEE